MRIAILYICTGNYTVFWPEFYASCEEFFFRGHDKSYFVFTDGSIESATYERVRCIEQQRMGWPHDTLQRFAMFERHEKELEDFDLVFFCNANVEFMRPVSEEILPIDHAAIIVAQHPGYVDGNSQKFQFEHNPRSRAFIKPGQGKNYVCGGFNGGYAGAYLQMIHTLSRNIQSDLEEGIIARWHDESHLNRYILENPYHILPVSYCHPQYESFAEGEVVRIREKICYGGAALLRKESAPLLTRIRDRVRYLLARWGMLTRVRRLRKFLRTGK